MNSTRKDRNQVLFRFSITVSCCYSIKIRKAGFRCPVRGGVPPPPWSVFSCPFLLALPLLGRRGGRPVPLLRGLRGSLRAPPSVSAPSARWSGFALRSNSCGACRPAPRAHASFFECWQDIFGVIQHTTRSNNKTFRARYAIGQSCALFVCQVKCYKHVPQTIENHSRNFSISKNQSNHLPQNLNVNKL